jgi:hypothetical protein
MPLKDAFQDAFKTDYETLGKELRGYFNKGKLFFTRLKGDTFKPGPVTVQALADPENATLMLEAQLRVGISKDDRDKFTARFAKAVAPIASTPAGRLAQAEWEVTLGDASKVTALLAPVLTDNPSHPRALGLQAYAAGKLAFKSEDAARIPAFKVARSWAVKANRAAPETSLPLMMYYLSFMDGEKEPPEIAVQGLEKAWDLMPQDSYLTMLTATALARANQKERARAYLRPLMNNPHGGAGAKSAQKLMAAIDAGQKPSMGMLNANDSE